MERAAVTQIWVASWDHFGVCLSVFQFTLWSFVPVMSRATTPPLFSPLFSHVWQISFLLCSPEKRGEKIIKWKHLGATFPWDALCVRSEWPETISCLTFCFVLHRDANCLHERGSGGKKPHTHTHTELGISVLTSETGVDKNISAQGSTYSLVVMHSSVPSHVLHLQMVCGQLWGFGSDGWRLTYVILK